MELIKSNDRLEIKSKINFYFIQFFGFSIATLFIIFRLIHSLLEFGYQVFDINYLASFCLFILFFVLSIWFFFGFEKIIIDKRNEKIEIVRSNYIFTHKKLISLNKIKKIDCYQYKDDFFYKYRNYIRESQRSFLWFDMGKINIYTFENKISILNGLNKSECKKAFDEINKFINIPTGARLTEILVLD